MMEPKLRNRLGKNRILSLKKKNQDTNLNNDNKVSTSNNSPPKKYKISKSISSLITQEDEIPLSFDVSSYFQNETFTQMENINKDKNPETVQNSEYTDNELNFNCSEFQLTCSEWDKESVLNTNHNVKLNNSGDELSQFYESSQVLQQLETVMSSCDVLNISEEQKESFQVSKAIEVKQVLQKVKENDNMINDTISDEISGLFKSTQYKREVSGIFDQLESTICQITTGQDINLQKDTSLNDPDSILSNSFIDDEWDNDNILQNFQDYNPQIIDKKIHDFTEMGPFYGLPNKVKDLIQQYKGINKLYDWQDECLKLKAIQERKNLVYALPTSGGKTLVSEILIFREIMCRKKNVIFVLPYVSIVQEKVWALSPFALALNFLVEEYAAGKGKLPPRRRRTKRSVYIATIEKALGVINALVETNRLSEIGLVVVDELHLLGEGSRGATLEQLLTKLMYSQENIHLVGMSATIGNLKELCLFLKAEVYAQDFRPIELKEYVKCGLQIAEVDRNAKSIEESLVPSRTVDFQYSEEVSKLDPDRLGGLVMEIIPSGSCLVFCASKKNCENVALLLSRILFRHLLQHRQSDKQLLLQSLRAEGAICPILRKTVPFGIAYHHSGLTADERRIIEDNFRMGTLSVICCTSTLAAGVNLPARRVILRSPYIGREFLNLARYKQMSGRAGRAGLGDTFGESILICESRDLQKVMDMLAAPMNQVKSKLTENGLKGLRELILSCIALETAKTRKEIREVTEKTLLAVQGEDVKKLTDEVLTDLFKLGAVQLENDKSDFPDRDISLLMKTVVNSSSPKFKSGENRKQILINNSSGLIISKLGKAAIKGGLDLDTAHILYDDLIQAQKSLVLLNCLHLLYLVTPYDLAKQIQPELQTYYNIYMELKQEELQTAQIIGIDEACCSSMMMGRRIKVKERILNRFYLTLILHELWNNHGVFEVSEKFQVSRGIVQQLMIAAATFAANVVRFCEELDEFWCFAELLKGLGQRLQHCSTKELEQLMELPAVKQARARQLHQAGYKTIQSVAKADPKDLMEKITHMSRTVANQLIASAKLHLLERVENLREEAEDVLEGIGNSQHHNIM